jgi:ABC-2 type transport system ATP-binding protein
VNAANATTGISVRNVAYRYRQATRDALREINIDIQRGSIFGLLGPNGAGKSTLLSLLSGSLGLQSGEISVNGTDLSQDLRRIKTISAIVPQEYAFYDDLSGQENLEYFAGAFNLGATQAVARIEHCAKMCRLTEVLAQRAGTYSGGQKRRLNLAIGLLNEPQILYLDEPTVGIDAESRQYIVDAIHDLRRTGVTIVYTSHYMEEVEQLCDAIAVIDHGRVVAHERMDSLLQRGGGRILHLRLKEAVPALLTLLSAYKPEHIDFRHWQLELPAEQLPEVLNILTAQQAQVERLQYGISRLEKIYLQLLANGDVSDTGEQGTNS